MVRLGTKNVHFLKTPHSPRIKAEKKINNNFKMFSFKV